MAIVIHGTELANLYVQPCALVPCALLLSPIMFDYISWIGTANQNSMKAQL